ncbi:MAG: response regulator transcription factor [Planctomycetia bacterium]|nr:response regulator transcription factor [Planctomycetia bacterium]
MKSQRIRTAEALALFHLAGELAELSPIDPDQALRHLLDRLGGLVGCRCGLWVAGQRVDAPAAGDPLLGWRVAARLSNEPDPVAEQLTVAWSRQTRNYVADPHTQAAIQGHGHNRAFLRGEVVDDQTWNHSPQVQELLRPIGISDRVQAAITLNPQVEIHVGFDRSQGDRPFGPHERELLRLAVEGLGWFHRRVARLHGLTTAKSTLTERERQVLSALLTGDCEKQIARQLGLTRGAAHQYVVAVFRKFEVRSRAELMARWLGSR